MFLIVPTYTILAALFTLACCGWTAWVALDKYHNLDRDLRREIVIGLIIITLICAPVGVIAAYWSKPIASA